MFGKTKDHDVLDADPTRDDHDLTVEQFFGDEQAAEDAIRAEQMLTRIEQVEQQLSSQFTSMAAYAQIAQEQVELARAEARNATERAERRVTELIERERADRISATGERPVAAPWGAPSHGPSGAAVTGDVASRIDAVESSLTEIRQGLNECLDRQKALADAITALFEPRSALPPPSVDGPIPGLAIT